MGHFQAYYASSHHPVLTLTSAFAIKHGWNHDHHDSTHGVQEGAEVLSVLRELAQAGRKTLTVLLLGESCFFVTCPPTCLKNHPGMLVDNGPLLAADNHSNRMVAI